MEEEQIEKVKNLLEAIEGLQGIPVPYNIIKHQIEPLRTWCNQITNDHNEDCDCDACIWARACYEAEFLDEHDH